MRMKDKHRSPKDSAQNCQNTGTLGRDQLAVGQGYSISSVCQKLNFSAFEAEDTSSHVLCAYERKAIEEMDTFCWRAMKKLMLLSVSFGPS